MTTTPRATETATSQHAAEGASLLRLENVEKTFGKAGAAAWALRRITLDVRPGEFLSIMGPSGAGKSTLLHVLGMQEGDPRQLSGGQQQLVGIARAVVAKPSLILADEPTGNLHSDQGKEIMELFVRLNQAGTTIVQVTHSDANAAFGHRTVRLSDGWIEDPSAHVPRSAALGDPAVRPA